MKCVSLKNFIGIIFVGVNLYKKGEKCLVIYLGKVAMLLKITDV